MACSIADIIPSTVSSTIPVSETNTFSGNLCNNHRCTIHQSQFEQTEKLFSTISVHNFPIKNVVDINLQFNIVVATTIKFVL